jgi:hypothetical protein
MTELEDDSITGSTSMELKNPEKKIKKSMYKENTEHRFFTNPEGRIKSDYVIVDYYQHNGNSWRSVKEMRDDMGLAERTVHSSTERMVKHEILKVKTIKYPDGLGRMRDTRLFKLAKAPRLNKNKTH